MIRIQNVLEHLKNQKDVERKKYKGDNLLESGEIEEAIIVYQEILNQEKDESVDEKFYGKIYACLGAAYGRLFLYQEAAKMYDRAYQICEDKELLNHICMRLISICRWKNFTFCLQSTVNIRK